VSLQLIKRTHYLRRPRTRAAACLLFTAGIFSLGIAACSADEAGSGNENGDPGNLAGGTGTKPADGTKNGDETDVDCGGSSAPKCADGKGCKTASDCASASCVSGTCAAPSPTDNVKNGDETDVDCGGSKAPKCAADKACGSDADCTSAACSYQKKCVTAPSCTGHFGGDTCGAGETGTADAKHESCCTRVSIDGQFQADKYLLTAGRMRAFVERYKGDLKTWAGTNPKGWNAAWTAQLPSSMDEALAALGPNGKRGCDVKYQGGRSYWQPPVNGDAEEKSDFSKDVLDEKALNCVPWHLAQALCVSDGGHLVTAAEAKKLFDNGQNSPYPWSFKDTSGYSPTTQDDRIVHRYSYQTPNPPTDMRTVGNDPLDKSFFIAPPGRRPTGANKWGVMDAAGNMLVWTNDQQKQFIWTMSWEEHPKKLTPEVWNRTDGPIGYYAIGARCSYSQ
jgi:hypothetical protein